MTGASSTTSSLSMARSASIVHHGSSTHEAALLRIANGELGHQAVLLPDLDVMAVDKLLGRLNGCRVIRAIQVDCFYEMAVASDEVDSIIGHTAAPYRGDWKPREFTHSLMCAAVSIC